MCLSYTSVGLFYELLRGRKQKTERKLSAAIWEPAELCDVWRYWYQSSCVNQQPVCVCSILHPAPIHTRPLCCLFSSAGVLSGDSSSGTHVPPFWHWPWVIEMQTENTLDQMGLQSSKYLARTFFFHWWSRLVYGRWSKVRADGRSVHREFVWVVLRSNKKLVKKEKRAESCSSI